MLSAHEVPELALEPRHLTSQNVVPSFQRRLECSIELNLVLAVIFERVGGKKGVGHDGCAEAANWLMVEIARH